MPQDHDIRAVFRDDGTPLAFYDAHLDADRLPDGALAISEDDWRALLSGGKRWTGSAVVDHVPAPSAVDLSAYAKAARDRHEEGGITVFGVPIATDDRSKTLVLGARRRVEKDPSLVTKWSAADGSIYPLNASTIVAVSDAIGDFVAELFDAYAGIMADLAAGTITTTGEIDARYGALDVAF